MFQRLLPARLWWIWLLLVTGLGVVFVLVLSWGTNKSVTGQQLRKQQVIARAETSNIISFFQMYGHSISVLAKLSSMETWDTRTVWDMDAFVEQWRDIGLVRGVVLTDGRGIVRFSSDASGILDIGVSLADRDYFLWAKNQSGEGNYFIGQHIIARVGGSKGEIVVPVASPVFQKGVFVGAVVSVVELGPLAERYLGLMEVSDTTDTYLLGQRGDLLYSKPALAALGSNIFDVQGNPFLADQTLNDSLKGMLNSSNEGGLKARYLNPESGKMETRLVAYSSISLENRYWLLIITAPFQEVTKLATPVYIRQTAILLLVSLTLLLFGIVVSRENKLKKD